MTDIGRSWRTSLFTSYLPTEKLRPRQGHNPASRVSYQIPWDRTCSLSLAMIKPHCTLAPFNSQKIITSVHFSHSVMSDSLRSHAPQHARPPCPSPTPGVQPNQCPSSWWRHPTVSSSVLLFCSGPQSFPASGSFQMSQLFPSGGQSIGVFSFNISPSNEHPGLISFRMDELVGIQINLLNKYVNEWE